MIFSVNFEDLNYSAQQRLLAFLGANHPADVGYDQMPICEIQHPDYQQQAGPTIINETIIVDDDDDYHSGYRRRY